MVGSYFRSTCASQNYDLYHEPNFIPFACDRPTITTVHDLSVLLHPHWHPSDRVRDFERNFERALRQTSHFLTVSSLYSPALKLHAIAAMAAAIRCANRRRRTA